MGLLACLLGMLVGSARADDSEIWVGAFVQAAPSAHPAVPRLWLDLHDRRNAAGSLAIVRPGIGWQLGPGLSVWAGYAWVPTLPDEADMTQEHRAWQQVSGQWPVGPVTVSLRLREEQRVRVGAEGLQHRLRVAPRVGVKIAGPVSLQVWDEVFLAWNETDWFPVRGYDQNRFFVGPGIEGMRGFRTEVGYLNHDLARGADSANNHALVVNLLFSLGPPGR